MDQIENIKCFGGQQQRFQHPSGTLQCDMQFSVFLPSAAEEAPVPVIYWLSGLTCNDQNFVTKAGAQQYAEAHGVAIVCPDTSPRGDDVPDDPEGAWDFGLGAGFYVNATEAPWQQHYRMYDYVVSELPALLSGRFPVDTDRASIMGHSMGGHGALTIALNNPGRYRSVSAFAPIASPIQCPWGQKALGNYLGQDRTRWRAHDTCALIEDGAVAIPMLVDQGDADGFLVEQLKPELLAEVAAAKAFPLTLRMQPGYDHSYYFIATFIEDHIAFHATALFS